MTTLTYGPTPYHRLKRQQLLTLAIALEAQRDACIERLNAVHAVVDRARKVSPSPSMTLYVADVERALGMDAPVPHKLGGNDGSSTDA